jgi:hypothetical protein
MIALLFKFTHPGGSCDVVTSKWTLSHGGDGLLQITGHGLHGDAPLIESTMDEFVALITDAPGRVVDLRKMQKPTLTPPEYSK